MLNSEPLLFCCGGWNVGCLTIMCGSRLAWAMLTGCRAWDIVQCLRKLAEEEGLPWLMAAFARCDGILHAHPYSTRAFYGSRLNRLKLRTLHGVTDPQLQPIVHVSRHPKSRLAHVMQGGSLCRSIGPLHKQTPTQTCIAKGPCIPCRCGISSSSHLAHLRLLAKQMKHVDMVQIQFQRALECKP